ncbi:RNA-directed DNA polymerase [Geobacter sulfurreducens subsp. ethanolicus]|uniref:RNA-directed DNA polymerase n=1 Tax=Geobacter sulfurreducens TaxID=35554 RepID=UPI00257471E8|nr:RNA-directed DNA polymerase [Geobacter sulfurreducens]BEH09847.1 RNA-directed DNA polymerase [Geobacter sulfurreducens subsp. ethanolicus]
MIPVSLEPKLNLLSEEYVLIQAWKKSASYIRSHNWYADTLELDRATVNLPDFLKSMSERLSSQDQWENKPLRIIPAPKSQRWHIDPITGIWGPTKATRPEKKIRPLAHVSLEDQVAATTIMLCLANRVETLQGNPQAPIDNTADRKSILSYGNRLFCDKNNDELRHRWGSSKLYRGYFQDYRNFLARPEKVAAEHSENTVIIHSDLRQYYDRVTPTLLHNKITALKQPNDDSHFYDLASSILRWEWNERDKQEVLDYAKQSGLDDFAEVALPQGLVASGFFSNIVLLDFDNAIKSFIDSEKDFIPGAALLDACRYVDDIRLVIKNEGSSSLQDIEEQVFSRLQLLLDEHAPGLVPSKDKTLASHYRGDERPLVRQSRKMERIQKTISGGFDAIAGEEILESIQGLVRSQARYTKERVEDKKWSFLPIADVRDETVARFAAARFRSTFRSLRPLLDSQQENTRHTEDGEESDHLLRNERKSQNELDDEARAFALGLIENWVEDPSNVRLLRIGVDLWPAKDILESILKLLRPYTITGGKKKAPRRIAWYCLAELLRAGATETGFVSDEETLPNAVNIDEYRRLLLKEAKRIIEQNQQSLPWYLKQQALLYIATHDPHEAPISRRGTNPETKYYRDLIRYLRGETGGLQDREYAILAILARRSFPAANQPVQLAYRNISSNRLKLIAERDPSFAIELNAINCDLSQTLPARIRHDLCLSSTASPEGLLSLTEIVLGCSDENRSQFSNELTVLRFTELFLRKLQVSGKDLILAPSDILVSVGKSTKFGVEIAAIEFQPSKLPASGFLYRPPSWCEPKDKWRFQLGYLLRFILTGRHDFTRAVRPAHWRESTFTYRVPESHWYQRIYGHHNGHTAFGADWLPITDWIEQFLYALLRWPGCRGSEISKRIDAGIHAALDLVTDRIDAIHEKRGKLSDVLMLPLLSGWPEIPKQDRPLRICVVQSVVPTKDDVAKAHDLTLSDPALRKKHRNHLSAALEAIKRMLDLRETHKRSDGRLDLLIFPELAIHPKDIETHLVPFARAYKSIIFAGLTYQELFSGKPCINSAYWLIPVFSEHQGLQVIRRRQGKEYLAPNEKRMNVPEAKLQGFRPCQWLVGYKWDSAEKKEPLWLTGSICFDATDIRLAADLRSLSDVYAVAAFNKDVSTFDQMALALQYHMFQMVIIANNGCYGGSNAYAPYREPFKRQVFHLHGQPQASMAFLEIDNIDDFLRRDKHSQEAPLDVSCKEDPSKTCKSNTDREWKCPPAGICNGDKCLHQN